MNNINDYIQEKLKINSKTKISNYSGNFPKEKEEQIIDELCRYFQASGSFGGNKYDNRLQIVDKFFHKDISEYFRRLFLWEDMAEFMNVDKKDLIEYVNITWKHGGPLNEQIRITQSGSNKQITVTLQH